MQLLLLDPLSLEMIVINKVVAVNIYE